MNISVYRHNGNTRLRRNQQKFKSPEVLPSIQRDPEEYVSLLSTSKQKVFEFLLWRDNKSIQIDVSQTTIARWCGLSREYVNRILTKLEKDGVIAMMYRHKKTSLYKVSSFFDANVRKKISYIFRSFKVFSLALLFSKPTPTPFINFYENVSENSSQYIKGKEIYIKTLLKDRETLYAGTHTREGILGKLGKGFLKRIDMGMKLPSERRQILENLKNGLIPNDFVSSTIKNISIIKLTFAGQVKLMSFSDKIIREAEEATRKFENLKSPFAFLFSQCMKISKKYDILPDFQWMNDIKRVLNIKDSDPSFSRAPSLKFNEMLASQWKDESADVDKIKEFNEASSILSSMAPTNQFAAILMKDAKQYQLQSEEPVGTQLDDSVDEADDCVTILQSTNRFARNSPKDVVQRYIDTCTIEAEDYGDPFNDRI